MKKIILFTSIPILSLIITVICFMYFVSDSKNTAPESLHPKTENHDSKVSDISPATDKQYVTGANITGYLMKSENSEIGIYEMYDNGNTQLIDSLNINPETLPDADKKDLLKGIVLTSYEKMLGLIEDYSS